MSDEEFLANLQNIDNEKLIQSLQNCGHDGYYNDLYYPIMEEIKRRLSSTSAEPERKWISASERLPKKEIKSYWVCTDTKYQCECRWTNNIYGIGESNKWGWAIFDIPQYTKVVAWMPLPVSWKGE